MEPRLMLLKDEKGTGWLINMDQVSAFAPTPDMKGTFVLFANGKTLVSPEPINKYFSQYPMPSPLLTPGVIDVEAVKTAVAQNENAQPK